ncbi:MAG: Signal recognition particle receptor FtsY [Candidatus Marinimicrobia bacterium]|nr:Signal recognition particle receptor FtsY [Candidatus Neomarinimicrobiota bacterium]
MRSAFQKLKSGLKKTHESVVGRIADVFSGRTKLDDELLEDLEEILIESDLGVDATMQLLDDLRDRASEIGEVDIGALQEVLQNEIKQLLSNGSHAVQPESQDGPQVIMVVGVNGSGKTTSIGKLAHQFKSKGKSVLIAAADTFRAAAMEQLENWADRANVDIIVNRKAKDPASVAYDAAAAAISRDVDVLIVDTAGRLHTQGNLMDELQKIHRVLGKQIENAPHEVLLVLDATTGQNAIMQARHFQKVVEIDGIILAKLDGTAKGGVVVAINRELDMPVKYIGVGEGIDDLQLFDPEQFAEALFY